MSNLVSAIRSWDGQCVEQVVQRRTVFLNRLMIAATRLGDGWAWVTLGLVVLILDRQHLQEALAPALAGAMLDIPLYSVLKHKFSRPRPFQISETVSCIIAPPDRFSFPSGHTSVAFVVLITVGSFYSWLFLPLALLALWIGASRVYLGVHYPTDVLAGAVLGCLCGFIGLWFS